MSSFHAEKSFVKLRSRTVGPVVRFTALMENSSLLASRAVAARLAFASISDKASTKTLLNYKIVSFTAVG
jgi:hypothetical protein